MSRPQLVWFKRDLRLTDHQPLVEALRRGPCIFLYIYEPELLAADDHDPSHVAYINDCLRELHASLRARGGALTLRHGPAEVVLAALHRDHQFEAIYSHQETGNQLTYQRDTRVKRWTKAVGIPWHEYRQHGVVRGLKNRDGWAKQWNQMMALPLVRTPQACPTVSTVESCGVLSPKALGLAAPRSMSRQAAGEAEAKATLKAFLTTRGERYQQEMSSPALAEQACSRLSTHIAYGSISIRTISHALKLRRSTLRSTRAATRGASPSWGRSMASFDKRLHWHCHFIQKLESEPMLEFSNMASAYDGLREDDFNAERFEAWVKGVTGYPMVDACMRYLNATGWLNFRMRAMVVSFASYHLWLHWRPTGLHLARQFLDYEPGIHYCQLQMQSGTTGINAVRIYSPIKQVADQDPEGTFIRRWVPELAGVPAEHIAEPHLMSHDEQLRYGCRIGHDYPKPIVEHRAAVAEAKRRVYGVRSRRDARAEAKDVFQRHGSRRRPRDRRRSSR